MTLDPKGFLSRFPDDSEIGRDINDEEVVIFYDNGQDVGEWRMNRGTTCAIGSVLGPEHASMARAFYKRQQAKGGNGQEQQIIGEFVAWAKGNSVYPPLAAELDRLATAYFTGREAETCRSF